MKKVTIITTILAFVAASTLVAQESNLWTYSGKKKEHTLGLYGGLNMSYSPIMESPAFNLGAKAGLVFDKKFGLGLAGYALSIDDEIYFPEDNRPVRLEAAYSTIFFEYIQPLGDFFKVNFSIMSGTGMVQYRYDKEYHQELTWTEEIPDRTNFSILEPGVEVQARLSRKWWLGINATYRFTSPVTMIHTEENILQTYTAGVSVKYGIY